MLPSLTSLPLRLKTSQKLPAPGGFQHAKSSAVRFGQGFGPATDAFDFRPFDVRLAEAMAGWRTLPPFEANAQRQRWLTDALMGNHLAGLDRLFQDRQLDVHHVNADGCRPVATALRYSGFPAFSKLINHPRFNPNLPAEASSPAMHMACAEAAPGYVMALAHHPKTDLNLGDSSGFAPIHVLAYHARWDLLCEFLSLPDVDPERLTQQGSTLMALIASNEPNKPEPAPAQLETILDCVSENQWNDRSEEPILHLACQYRQGNLIRALLPRLAEGAVDETDAYGLTPIEHYILSLAHMPRQPYSNELALLDTLVSHSKTPERYESLKGFLNNHQPTVYRDINQTGDGLHLHRQLPQLLTHYPGMLVQGLAQQYEQAMDYDSRQRGRHQNEAEFLTLLNHPDWADRNHRIDPLIQALTSPYRFHERELGVNETVVQAWQQVGLLTNGFLFWKYDSQGGDRSLLSRFGFEPVQDRGSDATYGKGYVYQPHLLSPLDAGTRVGFRRGYLVVSHPEHGTLLIRNSSQKFGRDLLPYPAYYSPVAIDDLARDTELERLIKTPLNSDDVGNLTRFPPETLSPMLWPTHYEDPGFGRHLAFLSNELMQLKTEYQHWKFDSTSFEGPELIGSGRRQFTGHLTPGLEAIRQWYIERMDVNYDDQAGALPDLAMVSPNLPPSVPIARMRVGPAEILDLGDILAGRWPEHTAWTQLIQAGVDQHAELVMLNPGENTAG